MWYMEAKKSWCELIYFQTKIRSWYIQRRLDYFFISNCLQDVITHADFFAALSTDHAPVAISISKNKNSTVLWCQAKIKLQNHKNLIQTFHSNQNFILNA